MDTRRAVTAAGVEGEKLDPAVNDPQPHDAALPPVLRLGLGAMQEQTAQPLTLAMKGHREHPHLCYRRTAILQVTSGGNPSRVGFFHE